MPLAAPGNFFTGLTASSNGANVGFLPDDAIGAPITTSPGFPLVPSTGATVNLFK